MIHRVVTNLRLLGVVKNLHVQYSDVLHSTHVLETTEKICVEEQMDLCENAHHHGHVIPLESALTL